MTQARIVLRDAALSQGEHLLRVTKLGSLTELINVMFSRYGRHLETTWEVLPAPNAAYSALGEPAPEVIPVTTAPESDWKFDDPITGL